VSVGNTKKHTTADAGKQQICARPISIEQAKLSALRHLHHLRISPEFQYFTNLTRSREEREGNHL
jgi:hypothetical protein